MSKNRFATGQSYGYSADIFEMFTIVCPEHKELPPMRMVSWNHKVDRRDEGIYRCQVCGTEVRIKIYPEDQENAHV